MDLKRVFAPKPKKATFTKYDRLLYEIEQRRERGEVNHLKAMCAMRWLAVANSGDTGIGALSPQQIQLIADDCYTNDNEESLVRDMDAYFQSLTKIDENTPVPSTSRFAHVFAA
ncbi:hypothetical protein ATE66_19765 [Sphingopyxis sp. H107]|nr:hypothetical protein ATE66_19765 [Sphingopyxis sp. H107]